MINNITNYIDRATYFSDLKVIDERLSNLEHNIDRITKNLIELLDKIDIKPSKGML